MTFLKMRDPAGTKGARTHPSGAHPLVFAVPTLIIRGSYALELE
jgi:hypothetical protein